MNGSSGRRSDDGGLVQRLSSAPERLWPDGVIHHGFRIFLLAALAVVATFLFPPVPTLNVTTYDVGTVVDEDLIAEVPFAVPKRPEVLERDRAEAAASVPPTFEYRPEAADSVESRLARFFEEVDSAAERSGDEEVRGLLGRLSIVATPPQITLLTDSVTFRLLRDTALGAARRMLPQGVVDAARARNISTDRITLRSGGQERTVARDSILSTREFYDAAVEMLPASSAPDLADFLRLVLIRFVEPTYVLDPVATDRDKDAARSVVPTTQTSVLAGEAIVRANQQVGRAELEKLEAYERQLRSLGALEGEDTALVPWLGATLQHLLILGIFGLLLYFYRTEVYAEPRWVLLQSVLILFYLVLARVVAESTTLPPESLPIAFAPLAVAVLWDGRMAMVMGFTLALMTGLIPEFGSVELVALTMVSTAAAALSVRAVRRRMQAWFIGVVIALANVGLLLAFALVHGREVVDTLGVMGWAGGSGMLSAVAAMSFLPLFERFTGITTDQTLLEWADPNQDLLKRLSLEAPGTYAHSIQVANLSEAAANAIGANGLLCRVGVYYHDVGKMLKPQYFVENQPGGRNPHDKLKPSTSASIVREHITEGLRLAREARLPQVLRDFIAEHHGTQEIGFFLEKAREEEDAEELDVSQFSYPGPKPGSKETAIAMLADSSESATRTLQEPTPERLRSLIDRIVETKIQAGQLDEAPLTLGEISVIKEQFAKVLGGIYHQRLDYPATKDITASDAVDPTTPAKPADESRAGGEDDARNASGPSEDTERGEARDGQSDAFEGAGEPRS